MDGAQDASFLAVDKRLQSDFAYRQLGLVRRTLAHGTGDLVGEWLVIDLWRSAEDADNSAALWDDDSIAEEFMSFVDMNTLEVRRYSDLD